MKVLTEHIVLFEYLASALCGVTAGTILGEIYIKCSNRISKKNTDNKNNARRKVENRDV